MPNGSEPIVKPESPVQLGLTGLSCISSEFRCDILQHLNRVAGYKQCSGLNLLAASQQARAGGVRRPYLLLAVTRTTKAAGQLRSVLAVKGFTFIK